MKTSSFPLLLFVFVLTWAQAARAQEPADPSLSARSTASSEWKISASINYESGDFDTEETTQTVYIPLTLTRLFERGDVSFTMPYIHQESPRNVTAVRGKPFQTGRTGTGTRTENGLGDIILAGGYDLLREPSDELDLRAAGSVKFPTADEDKGLGTGEFDQTLGLEAGKALTDEWTGYLDLYYTFIGDPQGQDFDDQLTFDIGAGYRLDPQTEISGYYRETTALVDGLDPARALCAYLTHDLDEDIGLLGGLRIGLSEGSPAFGLTGGCNIKF